MPLMPVYQYRCDQGHHTDLFRDVEAASKPIHCPECGQSARRLFKLGAVRFNGPGFYTTDYAHAGVVTED